MEDNILITKISKLLVNEEDLVQELILEAVNGVATSNLSIDAHSKKLERYIDRKLKEVEEEEGNDHTNP